MSTITKALLRMSAKSKRLRQILIVACIGMIAVAATAWGVVVVFEGEPVFTPPEPAAAGDLHDPALAGTWRPVGFWVDGKPIAELIVSGSSIRVRFFDEVAQTHRTQNLLVLNNDTESPMRGLTTELLGGWGVPTADIGTTVELAYRQDADALTLGWDTRDVGERPSSFNERGVMALNLRRYGDAPAPKRDAHGEGVDVEPALQGRWLFVPEDMRMTVQADRTLFTSLPGNAIAAELLLVNWQTDIEPHRIESIVIGAPTPTELGRRSRVIYTEIEPGRIRLAEFPETSPLNGQWPPAFATVFPVGLVTSEWERIRP